MWCFVRFRNVESFVFVVYIIQPWANKTTAAVFDLCKSKLNLLTLDICQEGVKKCKTSRRDSSWGLRPIDSERNNISTQ